MREVLARGALKRNRFRTRKAARAGAAVRRNRRLAALVCGLLCLPLVSRGKELGGGGHTTMVYSRDKVEDMCRTNDRIAKDVDDIKNIILKK